MKITRVFLWIILIAVIYWISASRVDIELDEWSQSENDSSPNPKISVYNDADPEMDNTDYVEMYHDQTVSVLSCSTGMCTNTGIHDFSSDITSYGNSIRYLATGDTISIMNR